MMRNVLLLALIAACTTTDPGLKGTQSLQVKLDAPTDPGSENSRIDFATNSTATIEVTAIDVDGNIDTTFDNTVGVYVNYLGTLTPYLCDPINDEVNPSPECPTTPLATITMANGVSTAPTAVPLPPVFGPATLWVDDGQDMTSPTYAVGTSDTLWYRDPFIADTQDPGNVNLSNQLAVEQALDTSPLAGKNVSVLSSRYGANGRLVVTSVFAQGYTVADVQCTDANGTPPCVSKPYDYEEVFSFSAPEDQNGCFLLEGQTIDGFAGGMSDFDGLTEVGFPQTFVAQTSDMDCTKVTSNPAMEPTTTVVDSTWFTGSGQIQFEENEAGAIEVDNAVMCNLDSDYDEFSQWKVDPAGVGGDCSRNDNVINIIASDMIQGLDTAKLTSLQGQAIPKIVGILRPINIGSFNVWLIFPRGNADVQLP
jgi:hypothetical protein